MTAMRLPATRDAGGHRSATATVSVLRRGPDEAGADVVLSPDVARAIGLTEDGAVVVRAGTAAAPATVRIGGSGAVVGVGAPLAARLAVPSGLRLHVRYDPAAAVLGLGPFVGILALRARRGPMYGDHEPFFRALARQGRPLAVPAFMFSPRDVRWQDGRIDGYVPSAAARRGGWRKQSFPLPDVVYDRVQTRRAEANPNYVRFRRRLIAQISAWFNEPGFFDKWRLHSILWENEKLRPYLPETKLYLGPADLEHMLRSYPVVYAKPVAGSLGAGIMKIQRRTAGFSLTYEIGERAVTRFSPSLPALHRLVFRFVGGKTYIVQQGLPLARWHGRPFDVRVLLQRDGDGRWKVTKLYSRISAPGGITSNLTRGADACNIHLLLRAVFGRRQRRPLHRQLVAVGIHCAEQIAAALPGPIGELGLDLGMTRSGRVWLIEANSKPFMQMNREAGSRRTLVASVRRPLQFAKHLAGF